MSAIMLFAETVLQRGGLYLLHRVNNLRFVRAMCAVCTTGNSKGQTLTDVTLTSALVYHN
jgi:hypothetical protein